MLNCQCIMVSNKLIHSIYAHSPHLIPIQKEFSQCCNVKGGGCLLIVQSDLILDFWHNCINCLVVTAPHHCCMGMHGRLVSKLCGVCKIGHGDWHWWSSTHEGGVAEDGAGKMEWRWMTGGSFWRKPTGNWRREIGCLRENWRKKRGW